ncbi:MAG: DMT family transporter, partial [Aeoliella sp.]
SIVPAFDLSDNMTLGVVWGVLSSLTFAVLVVLNRWLVAFYPPLTISLYQNAIACLVLLPFVGGSILSVTSLEFGQLALLGVIFTAVAHTLFISGMQVVRAQLASVIACLEPIYGILFAMALLDEVPSTREFVGGVVVIGAMVCATRRSVIAKPVP